jgi:chromosome segregation ATPase
MTEKPDSGKGLLTPKIRCARCGRLVSDSGKVVASFDCICLECQSKNNVLSALAASENKCQTLSTDNVKLQNRIKELERKLRNSVALDSSWLHEYRMQKQQLAEKDKEIAKLTEAVENPDIIASLRNDIERLKKENEELSKSFTDAQIRLSMWIQDHEDDWIRAKKAAVQQALSELREEILGLKGWVLPLDSVIQNQVLRAIDSRRTA